MIFNLSLRLPAIQRGAKIERYYQTTDNKLIEYDFHACLVDEDSPYQNVKIMSSYQFGNVLILNNDVSKLYLYLIFNSPVGSLC